MGNSCGCCPPDASDYAELGSGMPPSGGPVDANGKFVKWPGVALITQVHENWVTYDDKYYGRDKNKGLPKIERLLKGRDFPLLSEVFAGVVPVEAYHVTYNPLFTQDGSRGGVFGNAPMQFSDAEWQNVLSDQRWQEAKRAVQTDFAQETQKHYYFKELKVADAWSNEAGALWVTLRDKQQVDSPGGLPINNKLRDLVKKQPVKDPYHLTLAYRKSKYFNRDLNEIAVSLGFSRAKANEELKAFEKEVKECMCYGEYIFDDAMGDGPEDYDPGVVVTQPQLVRFANLTQFQAL